MADSYDRYENEGNGGGFMMGLLTGTVLGAGLGMLLAPKAGSELRGAIGEQARNLANTASDQYRRASESAGTWDLEAAGSTNIMTRQGWTRVTLKTGDRITAVVHPMKDGAKGGSLFYVILPDGTRLYTDIARPKAGT